MQNLLEILAIILIIEGLLPTIMPQQWKKYLQSMTQFSDRATRSIGIGLILIGVILLKLL